MAELPPASAIASGGRRLFESARVSAQMPHQFLPLRS
jgi:hypothetical protein